jgi:hypothetical protein
MPATANSVVKNKSRNKTEKPEEKLIKCQIGEEFDPSKFFDKNLKLL